MTHLRDELVQQFFSQQTKMAGETSMVLYSQHVTQSSQNSGPNISFKTTYHTSNFQLSEAVRILLFRTPSFKLELAKSFGKVEQQLSSQPAC